MVMKSIPNLQINLSVNNGQDVNCPSKVFSLHQNPSGTCCQKSRTVHYLFQYFISVPNVSQHHRSIIPYGVSGGASVLGKLPVPGRPT